VPRTPTRGGAKPASKDERSRDEIAALLVERAGYEARKLPDRVAQVDAQVKARRGKPRA
jgi:hypothetical protein